MFHETETFSFNLRNSRAFYRLANFLVELTSHPLGSLVLRMFAVNFKCACRGRFFTSEIANSAKHEWKQPLVDLLFLFSRFSSGLMDGMAARRKEVGKVYYYLIEGKRNDLKINISKFDVIISIYYRNTPYSRVYRSICCWFPDSQIY